MHAMLKYGHELEISHAILQRQDPPGESQRRGNPILFEYLAGGGAPGKTQPRSARKTPARWRTSHPEGPRREVKPLSIDTKSIFLNVPFDERYESLFVTLVGALILLGQKPRCVLEVRERGDGRLARIYDLIRTCRISIHDLSRAGTPARFNMAFELGLACALKLAIPPSYEIIVLDAVEYRIDRTLSDYKGRDPLIHHGTCAGVIACLLDAFQPDIADPFDQLVNATRLLRRSMSLAKQRQNAKTLFRPALFQVLRAEATVIAEARGFIPPTP
jgi:hypothetical protein